MDKELLIEVLKSVNFKIFDNQLNIVAVRKSFTLDNKFTDEMYVWSDSVPFQRFQITTKPGRNWWENFTRKEGVAALVENQYIDTWALGFHRGQYEALVQAKPVLVYRDNNKNTTLDTKVTQRGLFGINVHRANRTATSLFVNLWSAGCLVFANPNEYSRFMNICKESNQDYFTVSLINNRIIDNAVNKRNKNN